MEKSKDIRRRVCLLLWAMAWLLPTVSHAAMPADTKVSVDFKSVPVVTVLNAIQKQAGLSFVYSTEEAARWPKVTIRATRKSASEVVGQLTSLIGCSYTIKGNIVTITRQQLSGRERTVRGHVTDETGEPLVGVPVCIGESRVCTVTDADGFYTFKIPVEQTILKFSYVSMATQYATIQAGMNDVSRDIVLLSDNEIKEVVVNGYYQQTKESFTGAAKTFTQEELMTGGNQNILSSLSNIDPSFVMVENNSMGSNPNAIPDFTIRGSGSLTSMSDTYQGNPNMPIFIVDVPPQQPFTVREPRMAWLSSPPTHRSSENSL